MGYRLSTGMKRTLAVPCSDRSAGLSDPQYLGVGYGWVWGVRGV